MAGPRKTAKYRDDPPSGKIPRLAINPDDVMKERPLWRFARFDANGEWGRSRIELDHLFDHILTKMSNYESMTWGQIHADRKRNHSISTVKLIADARRRLSELTIVEEKLFRFRLSGEERVWGIVDGAIFYVLWWDPEHQIYPSKLKRT